MVQLHCTTDRQMTIKGDKTNEVWQGKRTSTWGSEVLRMLRAAPH